jgi:hypothetical protein
MKYEKNIFHKMAKLSNENDEKCILRLTLAFAPIFSFENYSNLNLKVQKRNNFVQKDAHKMLAKLTPFVSFISIFRASFPQIFLRQTKAQLYVPKSCAYNFLTQKVLQRRW